MKRSSIPRFETVVFRTPSVISSVIKLPKLRERTVRGRHGLEEVTTEDVHLPNKPYTDVYTYHR